MSKELDISTTSKSKFDVLIVGDQGVGKSTLLYKYITGLFCEDLPSEECVRVKTILKELDDNKQAPESKVGTNRDTISILDSSASLSSYLTDHSFLIQNARSMLFTYSIDSLKSFEDLEYTMTCIRSLTSKPLPCAIAALKMDLIENQQVSLDQGLALAERFHALAFNEVSSKQDVTVDKVFESLIEKLKETRINTDQLPTQKRSKLEGATETNDNFKAELQHIALISENIEREEEETAVLASEEGYTAVTKSDLPKSSATQARRKSIQLEKKKSRFSIFSCFSKQSIN